MKLHVDLETLQLIEGPGFRNPVTALRFKRGDAVRLEVVFLRNGTTALAIGDPATLELQFGVKPRNRYDVGYLVHSSDWTLPSSGAESPLYQCSPSFNTVELDSALGVGSSTGSELSEITLMGEITWREGVGDPTSTRTFLVVVENDVNRGDEGVPESAEPAYPAPGSIELVSRKGVANGYAGLDSEGKVPLAQLPETASPEGVELVSRKGQPDGYAALDSAGKVPLAQMPVPEIDGNGYAYGIKNVGGDAVLVPVVAMSSPPNSPSNLQVFSNIQPGALNLIWENPAGVTHVEIQRSTDAVNWQLLALLPAEYTYADTTVEPGVFYYYRARAGISGLWSEWSSPVGQTAAFTLAVVLSMTSAYATYYLQHYIGTNTGYALVNEETVNVAQSGTLTCTSDGSALVRIVACDSGGTVTADSWFTTIALSMTSDVTAVQFEGVPPETTPDVFLTYFSHPQFTAVDLSAVGVLDDGTAVSVMSSPYVANLTVAAGAIPDFIDARWSAFTADNLDTLLGLLGSRSGTSAGTIMLYGCPASNYGPTAANLASEKNYTLNTAY